MLRPNDNRPCWVPASRRWNVKHGIDRCAWMCSFTFLPNLGATYNTILQPAGAILFEEILPKNLKKYSKSIPGRKFFHGNVQYTNHRYQRVPVPSSTLYHVYFTIFTMHNTIIPYTTARPLYFRIFDKIKQKLTEWKSFVSRRLKAQLNKKAKKKRSSSYRNPFTNISINRRLLTTLQYYFISQKYKLKRNQQKLIWKRKPGEQGIQIFVIFPFPIIKSLSILTKTISTAHQLSSDSQRYSTGLKTHRVG